MTALNRTIVAVILCALTSGSGKQALADDAAEPIRIGTYDSRFVALAYYRQDDMAFVSRFMTDLALERAEALETGDQDRVREIEAKGPALQNLMHQQVFGNLSIPNVMAEIADRLPDIAGEADVSLIVSKWDTPYLGDSVETVDVTSQLIALFDVDDATGKIVSDGIASNQVPVSVMELLNPYE